MTCHVNFPGVSRGRARAGQLFFGRTTAFEFELIRALWAAPFGGADFGEVVTVLDSIRDGDTESWYRGWSVLAKAVGARAHRLVDPVSRGNAALRASSYMRTAEFFLHGSDSRRAEASEFCRQQFYAGLDLLDVDYTRSSIPYDGVEMETLFLRSSTATKDDVLVIHGGFDSTPEELYFTIGAAASERGFHVLIWEGPGQGQLLRKHHRTFIPEWEHAAAVALQSIQNHVRPRAVIGVGISLGGYLMARAAAYLPDYHGVVLFDYFPPPLEALEHKVPRLLRPTFRRMPFWMERAIRIYSRLDTEMAWAISNAEWTFGTGSVRELVERLSSFDDHEWPARIDTHVLALLGEGERFFDPRLADRFVSRLSAARSVALREFSRVEGGQLHCRNGAAHLAHEQIFDWIRRTVLAEIELGVPSVATHNEGTEDHASA